VFLLLSTGELIASLSESSSALTTRLSNLVPASPGATLQGVTTDGTGCGIVVSRSLADDLVLTTSNGVGEASWRLSP